MTWRSFSAIRRRAASGLFRARHGVGWRWRKARGRTGDFARAEDSERSKRLTDAWQRSWGGGTAPVGYMLRERLPDKWVRFHSLPGSKRYAENPAEAAEILRRHRTVLAELSGGRDPSELILIAQDWSPRDLASGSSKRHLEAAWPWRVVIDDRDPDAGPSYLWVQSGANERAMDRVLGAAADDEVSIAIAGLAMDWVYWPYDGGADVFVADPSTLSALRERHSDWLSPRADGL